MVAPSGEYVLNKYRHPGFAIAYTVAKEDVGRWIAGKRYIPQQKSPRKDRCPFNSPNSISPNSNSRVRDRVNVRVRVRVRVRRFGIRRFGIRRIEIRRIEISGVISINHWGGLSLFLSPPLPFPYLPSPIPPLFPSPPLPLEGPLNPAKESGGAL